MPRLIAIDLGSHSVKVSTYRGSKSNWELEDHHACAVPQDGSPPALATRLTALDSLMEQVPSLRATAADIVAAVLPSTFATSRRVVLPFADPAQIEKTLPFVVESEVPFDLEDMCMGWRIAETGLQTSVLTIMSRKEQTAEWLAGLAERALDPQRLYVDGDCYGQWGLATTDGLVAVVDIGHTHTIVSVIKDGEVQLIRSVNVGGWNFTHAIQTAMDCSWEEAEQHKHGDTNTIAAVDVELTDPGVSRHSGYQELPAAARQKVDESIGLLLAEVRSTLIAAEDSLGNEVIEVRICGGSTRIDELREYFSHDLGVPVVRAKDPVGNLVNGRFALSHALGGVVGARDTLPIDLRVGELFYRGGGDALRSALIYGLVGTVVFTAAAMTMFVWTYFSLASELSATNEQIASIVTTAMPEIPADSIQSGSMAEALMRETTDDAIRRATVLGKKSDIPRTLALYLELAKAMPIPEVKVELTNLVITEEAITFNAETDGYASSAKVEERLRLNPKFKRATKGTETKTSKGKVKFPINIPLGEEAPAEQEG